MVKDSGEGRKMSQLLSFLAIISAIFTITSTNPVYSLIGLIATFTWSGSYLIWESIEFIGLSYLIVYVGAIGILFLFVVMMMNIKYIEVSEVGRTYLDGWLITTLIGCLLV